MTAPSPLIVEALMRAMGCTTSADEGDCRDCGTVPHSHPVTWWCEEHDWFESDATTEDACGYAVFISQVLANAGVLGPEQVRERESAAWDEGEQAGRDNADDGYPDPMVENPYRERAR